jgi:hypothetical protein
MKKILAYKLGIIVMLLAGSVTFLHGSNPVEPPKPISNIEQTKQLITNSLTVTDQTPSINTESPITENMDINNAIKRGSANDLAPFLNSSVEIVLPGNEGTFSKAQSQMILASFFSKNPVKSFVVKQEGSSTSTSNFVIGTYTSTSNKDFRVYYVTKKVGNKELIQHIEFELK